MKDIGKPSELSKAEKAALEVGENIGKPVIKVSSDWADNMPDVAIVRITPEGETVEVLKR